MVVGGEVGPIKKLVQKLHHSKDDAPAHHDGDSYEMESSHPHHAVTEGYVKSALHAGMQEVINALSQEEVLAAITNLVRVQASVGTGAAVREGLTVLGDEQGMQVVGKLVAAQAVLFAKTSMDPLAREAAREAAKEAVTGSYDAIERKMVELVSAHRSALRVLSPVLVGGAVMFLVPLLLSMWRFALFGLGPIY